MLTPNVEIPYHSLAYITFKGFFSSFDLKMFDVYYARVQENDEC